MSGSYRGLKTVAGLAATAALISLSGLLIYTFQVGSTSGYLEAESKQYQAEYAADTANSIKNCSASANPNLLRECIEKAIAANHDNQRDEKDLNAQRDMAEWAFWLLVISVVSVIVTGVGTGFLLWQIMLTREAVDDTGKATKAMVRQNELTEEQMRPWPFVEKVDIRISSIGLFSEDEDMLWCNSDVFIGNVGATPVMDLVTAPFRAFDKMGFDGANIRSLEDDMLKYLCGISGDHYFKNIVAPKQVIKVEEICAFNVSRQSEVFYMTGLMGFSYTIPNGTRICQTVLVAVNPIGRRNTSYQSPLIRSEMHKTNVLTFEHQGNVERCAEIWQERHPVSTTVLRTRQIDC